MEDMELRGLRAKEPHEARVQKEQQEIVAHCQKYIHILVYKHRQLLVMYMYSGTSIIIVDTIGNHLTVLIVNSEVHVALYRIITIGTKLALCNVCTCTH